MITANLLYEIVHCPAVKFCLNNHNTKHPCAKIVQSQGVSSEAQFQVPEPWNGNIESAPILFLSSNPSISEVEAYPRQNWTDEEIQDFFENRFGIVRKQWVKEGKYPLQVDGAYSTKHVRYWSEINRRATELLGRYAKPGIDYALTEVVHCKSRNNEGVAKAIRRY